MSGMRHGNGRPVCVLYCDSDFNDPSIQGGIVNFNLLRQDGRFVGYSEVSVPPSFAYHLSHACSIPLDKSVTLELASHLIDFEF